MRAKKILRGAVWGLGLILLSSLIFCTSSPIPSDSSAEIKVYFSPEGGAQEAVIEKIDSAKESIDVAMYAFTSRELAWALVRAHDRGVKVRALLDGDFDSSSKYSKATFLDRHQVDVRVDRSHIVETGESEGHMHQKFAVIDGRTVITGSYNWTASAEKRNDENLLILTDAPELCRSYQKEFAKLWQRGRQTEAAPEISLSATDLGKLRKHAGKEVTVRGRVYDVYHSKRSNTYFLHFGPARPCFTAVIFSSAVSNFFAEGKDPQNYQRKEIEVSGRLIDHPKYGLEIIVEHPAQITLQGNP